MQFKKFLLSFAATSLLITPLAINANGPATNPLEELVLAPAAGENAVVDGLSFQSEFLKHDGKTATIRVKATNETKSPISTKVTAALMQPPAVSPMARMVPMPREVAQNFLTMNLAPGESYSATITMKLPKDVTDRLLAASKKPDPSLVSVDTLEVQVPAPSFFASIRATEPSPPQAQQVARR